MPGKCLGLAARAADAIPVSRPPLGYGRSRKAAAMPAEILKNSIDLSRTRLLTWIFIGRPLIICTCGLGTR